LLEDIDHGATSIPCSTDSTDAVVNDGTSRSTVASPSTRAAGLTTFAVVADERGRELGRINSPKPLATERETTLDEAGRALARRPRRAVLAKSVNTL